MHVHTHSCTQWGGEQRELRQLVDGVCDVILYPSATDKSKNRGFAFVEFEQHRQAALARQKLTRDKLSVWGQQLCVDWAEPEQDVDESTMNQVRYSHASALMCARTGAHIVCAQSDALHRREHNARSVRTRHTRLHRKSEEDQGFRICALHHSRGSRTGARGDERVDFGRYFRRH